VNSVPRLIGVQLAESQLEATQPREYIKNRIFSVNYTNSLVMRQAYLDAEFWTGI